MEHPIDAIADAGNTRVIIALLQRLRTLGVKECCVAAGARNAAIIAALHHMKGAFEIRHFFEERSAAFFALGRVMESRRPVAVATTSGTAAAELLPAVIEAHYQALPLVALTADRPRRYAGSGAPQAIEQEGLFGCYVSGQFEYAADYILDSFPTGDAPIHINVRLEEGIPSLPTDLDACTFPEPPFPNQECDLNYLQQEWDEFWRGDARTIILLSGIHPGDVSAVLPLLRRLDLPIVAEATANLPPASDVSSRLIHGGEAALQQGGFTRVLRIGAVPSWRWWRDLEDRDPIRVLNICRAPFPGLARTFGVATLPWEALALDWPVPHAIPIADSNPHALSSKLTSLLDAYPNSEPGWIRRLSRLVPEGAQVFLGNSLPIREWNFAAAPPKPGTTFFANRGANGIDGLVSTWLGLSAGVAESWCIVGDLSTLYDLSAPWIIPQLPPGKRRLVVIHNGGGKIFSRVPWLAALPEEVRRIIENQHAISFEHVAKMWGMGYRLLEKATPLPSGGDSPAVELWEIRPDKAQTQSFWRDW